MATGGSTDDDLERLRVQVDATRTELGEVAGAVGGLTELVTDLIRRSSNTSTDDRWQARLGSLETRLEMLETAIRGEVERIRATAGAVDALADDFKVTVGGTHNLVDLAATISDRLGALESLERGVRGAAQDVAGMVESRLDRDASERDAQQASIAERVQEVVTIVEARLERDLADRREQQASITDRVQDIVGTVETQLAREAAERRQQEAAVVDRIGGVLAHLDELANAVRDQSEARDRLDGIDRAIAGAQAGLTALVTRLEEIAHVTSDLPSMEDRITAQLRDATAWGDVLGRLSSQVSGVHSRIDETTQAQHAFTDALATIRAEVTNMQASLQQPNEGLTQLGERLDALTAAMRQVVASQPDPRPQLEHLTTVVESLGSSQPDVAEHLTSLAEQLALLRAGQPATDAIIGRVASILNEHSTMLSQLQTGQPQLVVRLDQLAADLTQLSERAEPSAESPLVLERLDRMATALAELRATEGLLGSSVTPLTERINELINTVQTEMQPAPDVRPFLEQLAKAIVELRDVAAGRSEEWAETHDSRLADVRDAVIQLRAAQPDLNALVEQFRAAQPDLNAFVEQLRAAQPDPNAFVERLHDALSSLRLPDPDVALAPVREQLDALAVEISQLQETRPALARVLTDLDALRSDRLDPDALQGFLSERIDHVLAQIDQLRDERPDADAVLGRVAALLNEHSQSLAALQAGQPQLTVRLDELAADLAQLVERPQAPAESPAALERLDQLRADVAAQLAALRAEQPDLEAARSAQVALADRVDRIAPAVTAEITAQLDALRALQPDTAAAQAFFVDRLDRLAADVGVLRASQNEPNASLELLVQQLETFGNEVSAQLDALRASQPDAAAAHAAQTAIVEQLDRIAAELAALRSMQPDHDSAQAFVGDRLDRLSAQFDALRSEQPDVSGIESSLNDRLATLGAELAALRTQLDRPDPEPPDVAGALEPLQAQLSSVDAQAAAATDALQQLATAIARTNEQVENIAVTVDALNDAQGTPADALTPIVDRLAIVVDSVSSMHGDVSSLAESIATLRSDRSQLLQLSSDTNSRLDLLAANLSELREAGPDLSDTVNSLSSLGELVESLQSNVAETHRRIDTLGDIVRESQGDPTGVRAAVAPLVDRLDAIATQTVAAEEHVGAVLESLADSFGRVDAERATAFAEQIDDVRQAVNELNSRQATTSMDVTRRFEELSAVVASGEETSRSLEAAVRASLEAGTTEQLGDLTQQVTTLSSDVKSTVRALVGLGADFTGMRTELQALAEAIPDRSEADAEVRSAMARLDAAIGERDAQLRETVERLDAAVAERDAQLRDAIVRLDHAVSERESDVTEGVARLDAALADRDASVRDVLTRLDEAVARTSQGSDFADLARQFDAAIGELRRDLQSLHLAASSTDVLDMVRSLSERDPHEPIASLSSVLHDLRADMQSMSSAMNSAIGELRADVNRPLPEPEPKVDVGALAAAASAAVDQLEGRIDSEFDTVSRQMEALGTLLGQVIDAVHRVETQVVGAHPVSEKMRTAAASVLDSLRANVRQRSNRS
jgi:chromosome segregation ATPase